MLSRACFAHRRRPALFGGELLLEFPDKAAIALEMTGEPLDELTEASPTPCASGLLLRFEDRRPVGEVVANEEGERFDQERLAALQATELAREPLKTPRSDSCALLSTLGRKVGDEGGGNYCGPADTLHGRQLVDTQQVLAVDANAGVRRGHSAALSAG